MSHSTRSNPVYGTRRLAYGPRVVGTYKEEAPVPTTLADLVGEPSLELQCAPPAAGPDRPVRWAPSTELLDPSPYLSGGELVCTVGTAVTGDETARGFVDAVAAVGVSGICFGIGDVHDAVPGALLAACRAHALPLLV